MDSKLRHQLKTDRFAVEVEHSIEYVSGHKKQVGLYIALGIAAVVLVSGFFWWRSAQHAKRQADLSRAIEAAEANVGTQSAAGLSFKTQDEKTAEVGKRFAEVLAKHPGTDEGSVAASYLGAAAADKGDFKEAEKHFQLMIDKGNANYASIGRRSLAQIYLSTNRKAEAEKLLRDLAAKPTDFVSKEQATIDLARALAESKPAEARKLLEPLRTDKSSVVSQAAIQALADLPASK